MEFKLNFSVGNLFGKKLAAEQEPKDKKGKRLPYVPKSVFKSRKDIADWIRAQTSAESAERPTNYELQLLYNDIFIDAHLFSQIENRRQQLFSSDFVLKNEKGEVDEEQTTVLKNWSAYRELTTAILDSNTFGYNLCEIDIDKDGLGSKFPKVTVLPRENVVPKTGLFYPDYANDMNKIPYRELAEFGTWILEFNSGNLGLLNRAVSHVLFKRFAQSCYSELCEIYGIPPRVIKTNTQDDDMLNRAEQQMRETGVAPWFIIDESETLEWGQGVSTNGDVFRNLIQLCKEEISLLFSGAVIGQDTVNGNRSKDESAQEMLWLLVQSDMNLVEQYWNTTIIPAFVKLGLLKGKVKFEFAPSEDIDQLWKFTSALLQYKEIDNNWLKEKFGVEIIGDKISSPEPPVDPKKTKEVKLSGFFV